MNDPGRMFPPGAGLSHGKVREELCLWVVNNARPQTVLDLGCGVGLYGMQLKMFDSDVRVIGVDAHFQYLASVFCQSCYDSLICAKIESVVGGSIEVKRDITIMASTIEHFESSKGEIILNGLDKAVISSPMSPMKQDIVDGNRFQEHKSWFGREQMEELGYEFLFKIEYPNDIDNHAGVYQKGVCK